MKHQIVVRRLQCVGHGVEHAGRRIDRKHAFLAHELRQRDAVHVFGNDYKTPDGTGVRDYIHVCDLGTGHVAALTWMNGREGVFTLPVLYALEEEGEVGDKLRELLTGPLHSDAEVGRAIELLHLCGGPLRLAL